MKLLRSLIPSLVILGARVAQAASSWGFDEAIISVSPKGTGVERAGFKDKLSDHAPLPKPVTLEVGDNLKIALTATEAGKPRRPHQAFLLLRDQDTGLETTFPFSMHETGKGKVEFTQKELPVQFLSSPQPLRATLLLASFGSSRPFSNHIFNLDVRTDPNLPKPQYDKPLRYGKLPEIHHIFKADPKSGPIIISVFFVGLVLATLPLLLGTWAYLGANLNHLQKALSIAPISHALFFGSTLSVEVIFLLYYHSWTLFQMLPVAGIFGLVAFVSGSKALSEVQARRMAGER